MDCCGVRGAANQGRNYSFPWTGGHARSLLPRGKSSRRSRHIGEMRDSGTKVTFDPQPLRAGHGEWHIVATYHPRGQQEHISGFRDEADAKEWLTGKGCQAWPKARGYATEAPKATA